MRQISSPVGGVFRKMGSCFGSPNSKNKGVSIQIPSKNRQNQWFSIIFKFRGPTFGPEISTFTSGKPRLTLRFGSPSKVNCLVRPRVKSRGRLVSWAPPTPTHTSKCLRVIEQRVSIPVPKCEVKVVRWSVCYFYLLFDFSGWELVSELNWSLTSEIERAQCSCWKNCYSVDLGTSWLEPAFTSLFQR